MTLFLLKQLSDLFRWALWVWLTANNEHKMNLREQPRALTLHKNNGQHLTILVWKVYLLSTWTWWYHWSVSFLLNKCCCRVLKWWKRCYLTLHKLLRVCGASVWSCFVAHTGFIWCLINENWFALCWRRTVSFGWGMFIDASIHIIHFD